MDGRIPVLGLCHDFSLCPDGSPDRSALKMRMRKQTSDVGEWRDLAKARLWYKIASPAGCAPTTWGARTKWPLVTGTSFVRFTN